MLNLEIESIDFFCVSYKKSNNKIISWGYVGHFPMRYLDFNTSSVSLSLVTETLQSIILSWKLEMILKF